MLGLGIRSIEVAIFIAVAYGDGSHTGGRSRSIKFHNSPNDQNCSINLKAVISHHQPIIQRPPAQ